MSRRWMLTAGGPTTTPIDVGIAAGTNAETTSNILVSAANPADGNGTITSVSARFDVISAQNVAFFTCSPTFVVRAISANTTSVAGQSSYPVSLAIQTGDYIGLWIANANTVNANNEFAGPPNVYRNNALTAAKPTVSATLSLTEVVGRQLNCAGTGTT